MRAYLLITLLVLLFTSSVQPATTQEALEIIEGILIGAFGDLGQDVKLCIQDGQEIFDDIHDAIRFFERQTKDGVEKGLAKIGDAMRLIPEAVKECEEIPELVKDFETIAEEFSNPEDLIVHIWWEVVFHGKSIFKDVEGAIIDFKQNKYESAGENIGRIIKILVLMVRDPVIDAQDFLEGFFKGALLDDSVDIDECITDATEVIEELEAIITDIKSGIITNPEKVFLDFIDLITEAVKSVAQCEKAPAEIEIMEQWIVKLKDINTMESILFKSFLYYPERLKGDFKNSIDSFETHDFSVSGFSLGDILHIFFVEVKTELSEDYFDDATKFTHGFYLKAFKINLNFDSCEVDVEDEWNLVKKAINELEEMSIEGLKKGVEDLYHAIPKFLMAFDECKELYPDIERGLEQMEIFVTDASKLPWAISKATTIHFIRFEGDCSQIYHGLNDNPHNLEYAGEGSGDLTALLISELQMAQAESSLVKEFI